MFVEDSDVSDIESIADAVEAAESHGYGRCPRCGRWAMEHLRTHSYCWECNYSPEESLGFRLWRGIEYGLARLAVHKTTTQISGSNIGPGWLGIEHPYEHERHLSRISRGIL